MKIKLAIALTTIVATFGTGYFTGAKSVQAKWDRQVTKDIAADHAVLLLGMKDSYDTGVEYEEQKQEIRYITQTVIEKIPVLIPDSSVCPVLPRGFGRLHRSSAEAINDAIASGKSDGKG